MHPAGRLMEENLRMTYTDGIVLSTDHSGYGSAELAAHHLGTALQAVDRLVLWRACDIMKSRRTMLMSGDVQPRYVFGDLLDRVDNNTRHDLDSAHSAVAKHQKKLVSRGEDPKLPVVGLARP